MKSTLRAAAAFALLLGATPAAAASFGAVYAFGDSLNDCCINPAAPFTNGPQTWLPAFAAAIGADYPVPETATRNYAIGGAQSGQLNAIVAADAGFNTGLLAQIERFEASGAVVGDDAVAVVWVGTNDIWPSAFDGDTLFGLAINKPLGDTPDVDALADHVAANIGQAAARLRDEGFGSLLILTPYDMANSALIDNPVEGPARGSAYSAAVRDRLTTLFTPGIDTYTLDMVALIAGLQAGSPGNGFEFLTGFQPCNAGGTACGDRTQAEQDSYIFNDFVHLTTATNAIVSQKAAALLLSGATVAPVPLPAPAALLLVGLGALTVQARRRG